MRDFATEYGRLNPEQKLAVDTVEGPVMVVAGPGTGKTQVLSMRVANILKKTQAAPSNILCLTFSNAGVTAMRERLRELIGGDAYGVTVHTVHGFADGIIKRYPLAFADFSAQQSLSDLRKYQLMQKIVDDVSTHSSLINARNPYDRIPDILSRISDCKREGKTLEELLKAAEIYDSEMSEKSRKGTKQHEKNLLQAKKFRDFIDLFKRYGEKLKEEGLYDYDDMILVVLKALKEEDWLLQSLQERFQYILVDEAQDLNGAQWGIIRTLITYDALPHDPNLFVVGDDDQSIYRFQGANMEHMLEFASHFPKAPVIVLKTNYRSTQPILDAAGRLISKNEERLIGRMPGLTKDFNAFSKENGSEPTLLRPPSDAAEPWLIADLIEERLESGVPPEEIAVLVQTNSELKPIYDVLRARDIPVVLQGKADLLTQPVVQQAIMILKSIESEADSPLIRAMSCECFGCHPADIARIIAQARKEERKPIEVLLSLERSEEVFAKKEKLIAARDTVLDLRQKSHSRTVLETVEHVLRESGIVSLTRSKQGGMDPLNLAVIEAFFQYVKQHCLDRPCLSLHAFMHDINFYADEGYGQVRLRYQLPHLVESGVQLLTAHQSKGLEFHSVILSKFSDGHWDERRTPSGLSLPEEILFGWVSEQKRFEKHQDERRVAYVAFTRAKRELILLCPREVSVGERVQSVSPSAFFAEAGPLPEKDAALKDPESSSVLLLNPVPELDDELRAYLLKRIETFALSPTSLARFLRDPEEFKRVDLLGQPEEFTEDSIRALGYGSAVHWALRAWALSVQEQKEFSVEKFVESFDWYLKHRTILTELQEKVLLAEAKSAMPVYYERRLQGAKPVLHAIEREYRAVFKDPTDPTKDIRLKGKIDRIDRASPESSDAIVMDYKTGAPKTPSMIRGGIEAGKVSWTDKGEQFRQLVFYSLLLEQGDPLLSPQVYSLEFVGSKTHEPETREFSVVQAEKDDLRALIRAVWEKILALDFTPLYRAADESNSSRSTTQRDAQESNTPLTRS